MNEERKHDRGLTVRQGQCVDVSAIPVKPAEELADQLFGLRFSVISCVRALLCSLGVVLLVRLRQGPPLRAYLGLAAPRTKALLSWLALTLVFDALADALWYVNGRPIVTDYNLALYETAYFTPLFWLALIVAAPVFEEILFRGFLFEGVRASRLGGAGAVLLSTAAWTAVHTQYEYFELGVVFTLGLLLGAARLRSGSIYTSLAMHMLNNLVSAFEIIYFSSS